METIKLDLIPGKKMPSLHASQYDDGRDYHIDLTENRVPYVLDGTETISVIVRKCDNTLVSMDIANTFANKSYLEFEVTEQMTACSGFNYGEIILEKNGDRLGSLNFYLVVEAAPDENGITSQSEIKNLARQVHDIVVEELEDHGASETGYDNTESGLEATNVQDAIDEVNAKIENIPSVDAYTKEETDNKFATKTALQTVLETIPTKTSELINDSDFATMQETDEKVAGLIDDTQALLNKTWSSKKSNDEIVNILPACTVSGSIAEFTTELSEPIISLMNDIDYDGNVVNNIKLANVGGSSENAPFFKGLVIGTKTFIDLSSLNWSYGNNNGHWARYYFFTNLSDRALINTVLSNDYVQTGYATNSPDAPDKSIFLPTNNTYIYICDSDITSVSDFVREMNGHYLIYVPATNTQGISESNFKAVCDSFEIASDYKIVNISDYSVYGGMLAFTPSEAILTSTTNADGTIKETPDVYNLSGITDFVSFIGQNNIFADSGDIIECKFKTKDIVSAVLSQSDVLTGKKWAVCGDSFTAGATNTKIKNGKYAGENYAYPFLIGNRVGIEILRFFASGRTLAYPSDGSFHNSLTDSAQKYYYQNIPEDVDYITIYLGINDSHHENGGGGDGEDPTGIIPLGTISDNTVNTYYGAWNVVLTWLMTYRPFAHIGIIVSNGCDRVEYRTAQLDIAKKYGIPYIDMNGDSRTPVMIRSMSPDISNDVKTIILNKQAVDIDGSKTGTINLHPNDDAHLYESYFIEDFLRTI